MVTHQRVLLNTSLCNHLHISVFSLTHNKEKVNTKFVEIYVCANFASAVCPVGSAGVGSVPLFGGAVLARFVGGVPRGLRSVVGAVFRLLPPSAPRSPPSVRLLALRPLRRFVRFARLRACLRSAPLGWSKPLRGGSTAAAR